MEVDAGPRRSEGRKPASSILSGGHSDGVASIR